MSLIYLASPYSDSDPCVVENRIQLLCKVDAELQSKNVYTVSPLYKHFILPYADIPSDWTYWQAYSEELLLKCDSMLVIKMDGWDTSIGVLAEIKFCKALSIPIEYYDIRK